jgi:hypothetical protein
LVCEELSPFLKAGCKDTTYQITNKVLSPVLFTFATQCIHNFQRTNRLIFKAGRKDTPQVFPAKSFLKETD